MCEQAYTGRLRESHPCGSLNNSYGAFLPGFLWPVSLLCLVLSPYLVYLKVLPCVLTLSQPRQILVKRPVGRLTSFTMRCHHLPFDSEEHFCTCEVRKVSLTLRMGNMWSLTWAGLTRRVSVHRGQAPAAQPRARLSPASVLHPFLDPLTLPMSL